jgi:radical SAM protein with 4Fe4S-binding SPASM domain
VQLDEVFMEESIFERLERTGHILTPKNASRVFQELAVWLSKSFCGPALHIVVLTKRCNLNCSYCHMNPEPVQASRLEFDMQPEIAKEVVRFAFESPNPAIRFEFQGGEPFLNFPGMVYFVEEARRQNHSGGKELSFAVVTNLMVARDEQLEFCRDNGISVSYTVDGPQHIHDHYRKTRNGNGSYLVVMNRLQHIQAKYPGLVASSPLCVVTRDNAGRLEEMIDFYYEVGFTGLAIVRLKHLGNARTEHLDFDIHEFLQHYLRGLDHIFEKNRSLGLGFSERMLPVAMMKILGDSDVGFVDWRNPCGDVSGAITYDYDGEILPADEARSVRSEFSLGNVSGTTYDALVRRKETFRTMNLSLRDRDAVCRECAYNPFCGVMPVLDYARTGDPTPRPHESDECLFTLAVLDWMFKKLITEPLPLFRMLPGIEDYLPRLLESAQTGATADKEAYPARV